MVSRWGIDERTVTSEATDTDGKYRKDIKPGLRVIITQKADQRGRKLTSGIVKDALITWEISRSSTT
jgi:uncharacterized protein YwbE